MIRTSTQTLGSYTIANEQLFYALITIFIV